MRHVLILWAAIWRAEDPLELGILHRSTSSNDAFESEMPTKCVDAPMAAVKPDPVSNNWHS